MVAIGLLSGCQKPSTRTDTPLAVTDDDRFNGDETIVRDWSFLGIDGTQIRTRHWDIRTTMRSERFKQILPAFYEMALDQYQNAFGAELPPPDKSLETYLFADRRQWKNKTRMILPDKAASFEGLGRGGFTTNGIAVLYDIDGYGWHRDTLALGSHEGWHQYVQSTFKDQLPAWLDEGIATTMEGFSWRRGIKFRPEANRERWSRLCDCVRNNRLLPLDKLMSAHPENFLESKKQTLLDYYAQIWALTRYLQSGEDGEYRDKVGNILLLAASGDLYRQLLRSEQLSTRHRKMIENEGDAGMAIMEVFIESDTTQLAEDFKEWCYSMCRMERG
ncbi:MAG: hypothetical protein CMJ40_10005 [Phycisphaerae bacterium]|nr:hypothetical protein [Phycisphaerae bacterium]|tara:strand:- start:448 stop:1443 length:996 start_codon:yes stop_codon:yes gene_type:complete